MGTGQSRGNASTAGGVRLHVPTSSYSRKLALDSCPKPHPVTIYIEPSVEVGSLDSSTRSGAAADETLRADYDQSPPSNLSVVHRTASPVVTEEADTDEHNNSLSTDTELYSDDSDFGSESDADSEVDERYCFAQKSKPTMLQPSNDNDKIESCISLQSDATKEEEDDNGAPEQSLASPVPEEDISAATTLEPPAGRHPGSDSDSDHYCGTGLLEVMGSGWKGPESTSSADNGTSACGEPDRPLSEAEELRERLGRCSRRSKALEHEQFVRKFSCMQIQLDHALEQNRHHKGALDAEREEMKKKFERQRRKKVSVVVTKYRQKFRRMKEKWKRARASRAEKHASEVDVLTRRQSAMQLRVQILESQKVAAQGALQRMQQQVTSMSQQFEARSGSDQKLASQLVRVLSKHMRTQDFAHEICASSRMASHELLQAAFENSECCVCMSGPRMAALEPCGHCVACEECTRKLCDLGSPCPVCRVPITGSLRIFT